MIRTYGQYLTFQREVSLEESWVNPLFFYSPVSFFQTHELFHFSFSSFNRYVSLLTNIKNQLIRRIQLVFFCFRCSREALLINHEEPSELSTLLEVLELPYSRTNRDIELQLLLLPQERVNRIATKFFERLQREGIEVPRLNPVTVHDFVRTYLTDPRWYALFVEVVRRENRRS